MIACLHNILRVSSFNISLFFIIPSCPWLVYGSSATSVIIPIPLILSFINLVALHTIFSSLRASEPFSSFNELFVSGNNAIAGIPNSFASWTIPTISLTYNERDGISISLDGALISKSALAGMK